MSGRVYLSGVGLALVALAFCVTDWALRPPFKPGVSEANVRRIKAGMTPEEVKSILGPRSGWTPHWRDIDREEEVAFPEGRFKIKIPDPRLVGWTKTWSGEAGRVTVYYDRAYRVTGVEYRPANPSPPSALARLRAWLGW
jgi:hypothetical protein